MKTYIGKHQIGHKWFKYYLTDELPDDKSGETDYTAGTIEISIQASEDELRDTLVHETIHAMLHTYGIEYLLSKHKIDDELFVRLLTPALMGAFDLKVKMSK